MSPTEHDGVYAFDADGKNPASGYLWRVSFINPSSGITPVPFGDVDTPDISPEIGITGTPVIDAATNILYVVAKTKEVAAGRTTFVQRLHALDLTTGAEIAGGPVQIAASVPGTGRGSLNGVLSFDPRVEHQRGALMLFNGVVYIPWAAHCDRGNYHGWVIGYQASNVQQQVAVYTNTPDGWGGGFWMSGGGVSADSTSNVYVVAGNGDFDARLNFSSSAIRLSTQSGLVQVDSFTPNNQDQLTRADNDMGVKRCPNPARSARAFPTPVDYCRQNWLCLFDRP
jgi:hypothetical protein